MVKTSSWTFIRKGHSRDLTTRSWEKFLVTGPNNTRNRVERVVVYRKSKGPSPCLFSPVYYTKFRYFLFTVQTENKYRETTLKPKYRCRLQFFRSFTPQIDPPVHEPTFSPQDNDFPPNPLIYYSPFNVQKGVLTHCNKSI